MIKHLLLIEDDLWLRDSLEAFLIQNKFQVSVADTLKSARDLLKLNEFSNPIHIVVSDVSLPDGLALDLFNDLQNQLHIGKILISASISEQDRIKGLTTGADDYLCKPISPEELLLRIKAVLRRFPAIEDKNDGITFLNYKLNLESRLLSYQTKRIESGCAEYLYTKVELGSAEFQLLLQLIARQGKIVTREALFAHLDNAETYKQGRGLDILVSRLRKKMLRNPTQENPIITFRGKGYMLRIQ